MAAFFSSSLRPAIRDFVSGCADFLGGKEKNVSKNVVKTAYKIARKIVFKIGLKIIAKIARI